MTQVEEQLARAYDASADGRDRDAIGFYDAVHKLGGPQRDREEYFIGYGATLRNVGRLDDAIKILQHAIREFPQNHALRCFLAYSLHTKSDHAAGFATMLEVVLSLSAASPAVSRFSRVLEQVRADVLRRSQRRA